MPFDDKKRVLVSECGGIRLAVTQSDESFIMTIGTLSITLSRAAAEELMCSLSDALEPGDPLWILSADPN